VVRRPTAGVRAVRPSTPKREHGRSVNGERRQLKMWVKCGNFLDGSHTHGVRRSPSAPTIVPTLVMLQNCASECFSNRTYGALQ